MCLITKHVRINAENPHKCVSEYSLGIRILSYVTAPDKGQLQFHNNRSEANILAGYSLMSEYPASIFASALLLWN